MKRINYSSLILFVLFSFIRSNAQNTSVYVSAHPDDWQLFMNPNAYNSVKGTNEKVIFIHTTAGDAGNGTGNNGYYLAREEGSLRAIRFMSNAFTSGSGLGADMNKTTVTINGHQITKFTYRNAVAYFLRLPDGSPSGNGYVLHDYNSLRKLYDGSISSISAIDGSTTYSSISDLITTVQAIIETEANSTGNMVFNAADHDLSINPDDHSDHIYSSRIVQDVANNIGGVTRNLYIDYYTAVMEQNVFNDAFLISAGTWGATASGITDNYHYGTWDADHNVWIGKQYYRTILSNANPNITVTAIDSSASEDPLDNGTFTVSLPSVNTGTAITVNYTISGTATEGSDYTALSGSVSIPNGAQSATITVVPINDTAVEPVETVIVTLAAGTGYNIGSPASATVNITSEDSSPSGTNIALNKPTSASLTDERPSSKAVDSNYALTNWWGATPYPQWWSVDLGASYDLSKIVVYNYYDGNRYYQYDIQGSIDGSSWSTLVDFNTNTSPATNLGNTFNLNNPMARYIRVNMNYNSVNEGVHIIEFEAYGTLSNNSDPNILITAIDSSASEDPLDNGTFTVSLPSVNTGTAITVNYTISGTATEGSDYTALSGSVSIPNGAQSATITVVPINDTAVEPVETVIVTLASGTGYNIGSPSNATVSITSEDISPLPSISVSASDSSASESPLDNGIFTVSLPSVNTGTAITVNYTISGTATEGSDYTALSGSVSIPNGAQSATIIVVPINDIEVEPAETVIVTLASGTGYAVGSPSNATVNISSEDTTPSGTNIALNKPTSASLTDERPSSKAVDSNYALTNWWGATPYPQWWSVDLGASYDLSKIVVYNYYDGNRYYQYDIQGSIDGSSWSTLVDFNTNTSPATNLGNTFNLNNPMARYIRVNMNYNSVNEGVHIIEFEAYGTLSSNPLVGESSPDSTTEGEDSGTVVPENFFFATLSSNSLNSNTLLTTVKTTSEDSQMVIPENYLLSIYPNPVLKGDQIKLTVDLPKSSSSLIEVFTMDGRLIFSEDFNFAAGINEIEIPSNKNSTGMLIVKANIQGEVINKKVYVQ